MYLAYIRCRFAFAFLRSRSQTYLSLDFEISTVETLRKRGQTDVSPPRFMSKLAGVLSVCRSVRFLRQRSVRFLRTAYHGLSEGHQIIIVEYRIAFLEKASIVRLYTILQCRCAITFLNNLSGTYRHTHLLTRFPRSHEHDE